MGRGSEDDPDAAMFAAAVADALPLARDAALPPVRPDRRSPASRRPAATARFTIERDGERVRGHALDAGERALQVLDSNPEPDATIDLHGLNAAAAARALTRFVADAARQHQRVVLVIHGRGLHSDGPAVLREAAIDVLTGPLGARVHGFTTAARRHGGPGALYVVTRC